jgi:hypothetical protein
MLLRMKTGQLSPQNDWTEPIVCLALCHDDEVGDRIVPITPHDCRRDFNGDFAVFEKDRFARVITAEEEKMLEARASAIDADLEKLRARAEVRARVRERAARIVPITSDDCSEPKE